MVEHAAGNMTWLQDLVHELADGTVALARKLLQPIDEQGAADPAPAGASA